MTTTTAASSFEILATDGVTWIPFMLVRLEPRNDDDPAFPSIQEALAAAENDAPVSEQLRPTIYESPSGGIGISYNVAPGVYTRSDGYAMAAGAMTAVQVPLAGGSSSAIVAIEEFGADLFFAQAGTGGADARVCRSIGGTGTGGGAFGAVAFNHASYGGAAHLGAGEYMRDLCLYDDGAGTMCLYASSESATGTNGRLHRTTDGINWTSANPGAFGADVHGRNRGRGKLKVVHWTTQDGTSAHRLVATTGPRTIAYTTGDDVDPFLGTSWVEDVQIRTGYSLIDLVGANSHVYFTARDGLFDLNEQGESPNLVSRSAMASHPNNGAASEYLDGYVYQSLGLGGMHRIRVEQDGVLLEQPGACPPGWGTGAESEWLAGYPTAFAVAQGCIVPAFYNPTTHRTAVFFGRDRAAVGIDSPNPLIWWGPEWTLNADYKMTRMHPSGLAGDQRLWMAAQSVAGLQPILVWGSLPDAGAPIDDLISGGQMKFNSHSGSGIYNPFSSIEFLPDGQGDRSSLKILNDVTYTTRGLSRQRADNGTITDDGLGTKLTVYTRAADALAPSSTDWGTGTDVTLGPTETVVPVRKQGYRLQHRIDFVNPQGAAATPKVGVLDACRPTQWPIAPSFDVKVLGIEYGDDVALVEGGSWNNLGLDPDWVTRELRALTAFGRTTIRDPWDARATVKVHQVLDRVETIVGQGNYRKHVAARIRLSVLETL